MVRDLTGRLKDYVVRSGLADLIPSRPFGRRRHMAQWRRHQPHLRQLRLSKTTPILVVIVLHNAPEFTADQPLHFEMVEQQAPGREIH